MGMEPTQDMRRDPSPSPADARFGTRAVLAAVALALVAVPFGLLLFLVQDKWRPLLRVDEGARDGLHGVATHHHVLVTATKVISTIGSAPVYSAVFALVAAWLVWRRLPRLAVFVVVTLAGSAALNALVKNLVDRARPVLPDPVAHANGMSFPSGHAQNAMVAFSVLLLVFLPALRGVWRRVALAAAVVMVLAIGFSRVALGVHFVSDVLAGYVLGAAWVALMTAAFSAWRRERGHGGVDPAEGLEAEHGDRIAGRPARGPRPGVGASRSMN
jgi:membrane-associated phospholipid phosphatase